jgi:hypothetical protein
MEDENNDNSIVDHSILAHAINLTSVGGTDLTEDENHV